MIYNYDKEIHDVKVYENKVVVKAKGSKSYNSGSYTNERNVTYDIELSHDQILEAATEILNQE